MRAVIFAVALATRAVPARRVGLRYVVPAHSSFGLVIESKAKGTLHVETLLSPFLNKF